MKKSKRLLCAAVAVALTMGASGAVFAGCVATNNEEDVKQVIAEIDISTENSFKAEFGNYAEVVEKDVILKRDLILSYINVGSNYAGYATGTVFETLVNGLVSNSIVTQYATAALLKDRVEEQDLDEFNALTDVTAKYEYILGGEESDGVQSSKMKLYTLLNGTLDSYEKNYLDEKDEYSGTGSRSTPTGVNAEKEDYIKQSYGVYTGYKGYLLEDAGSYEPLDGTRRDTRRKAYSQLVSYLKANYLVTSEDKDTTDILELSYVKETYNNYLRSQIITEYGELFEEQQKLAVDTTDSDGVYTYIKEQYDNIHDGELAKQKELYSDTDAFESAMSNYSESSFILYTPDTSRDTKEEEIDGKVTSGTYGYVYNILLPFSATQNIALKDLDSRHDKKNINDLEYYVARNELLKNIKTTDQRALWFNGVTNYSFDASKYVSDTEDPAFTNWFGKDDGRNYLFFENNLTKTNQYETLDKYYGKYSYNGKVAENKDGSYKLVANYLDIDGMLGEFKAYINFVLNDDGATSVDYVSIYEGDGLTAPYANTNASYYDYTGRSIYKAGSEKEIDYSNLVYVTGKVDFGAITSDDMFVKENNRYKAMSAVNELQYAYTTDTGVLSQFIGYTVSAYETNYIKEFEYAAQQAIRMGAGSFKVCAGSYGWHLIYVTEAYTFSGEVYSPVWTAERINAEGTFENTFYNWIKDADLANEISRKQSSILYSYNSSKTVTLHKDAYKDLTELK